MANETLDIIDITLLLRQRRCRECVDEELRQQGLDNIYFCEVEIVYEDNRPILLPFVVNRNTGRSIIEKLDSSNFIRMASWDQSYGGLFRAVQLEKIMVMIRLIRFERRHVLVHVHSVIKLTLTCLPLPSHTPASYSGLIYLSLSLQYLCLLVLLLTFYF